MATMTCNVSLTDLEAEEILTTAVEGGIGYWSLITECGRRRDKEDPDYLNWQWVFLVDAEDESEIFGKVGKSQIEKGVSLILSGQVGIRSDLHAQVASILGGDDERDVDASAADCIVQAGLFGKLVFG